MAAVLGPYGHIEWRQMPKPDIKPHQVLIRVHFTGICGSDQHIFMGDFHPRTPVPFAQGHEFAGTIDSVGKAVRDLKAGDPVTVDPIIPCRKCAACSKGYYSACTSLKLLGVDMNGGFAQYVAADAEMVYTLDDRIPLQHAALIEMFSIGFHACNRAKVTPEDTVLIWGAGRIGHSIAQAVRTRNKNPIYMIDVLDERLQIARQYDQNIIPIRLQQQDPVKVVFEETKGRGVDVAFEAVGHARNVPNRPNPVRGCIQSIRGRGTVCVLGLADEPAPVIFKELIWKEGRIIASRVSHGEFAEASEHLARGNLSPQALITRVLPDSQAMSAFKSLEEKPAHYLKIVLDLTA